MPATIDVFVCIVCSSVHVVMSFVDDFSAIPGGQETEVTLRHGAANSFAMVLPSGSKFKYYLINPCIFNPN